MNEKSSATIFLALLALCAGATAQTTRPSDAFPGDSRMGTCTHFAQGWDAEKFMPLIEKSGLGWIRDDLDWQSIEAQKGIYKIPDHTLAWIRSAHAHHVRVLAILNGSNMFYADHYDPQAFAKWAGWMAVELKDDVDALEILNEPNNFGFMKYYGGKHEGEGDSPWVARYVTLMNAAADAIKAANPAMPVIGFGSGAPVTYKQLALGTSPAVDAIADHPYSTHTPPEVAGGSASAQMKHFGFATVDERGTFSSLIDGFRQQSAKFHGPKNIWLTEWGFSTFQPLAESHFSGFTESAQSKYMLRRFVEGLGLGVNVSFIYEFRDNRDEHDAEDRFGIVRMNGEPKESFWAIVNLTKIFHDFRAASAGEVGAVNVFPASTWPQQAPIAAYRFIDKQGRPAVAIWATDAAGGDRQPRVADVELMWGESVNEIIAVDTMTGGREPVSFKHIGGRLVKEGMTIRDYPILLTAAGPALAGAANSGKVAESDLKLFAAGSKWVFIDGREFPGAAGSFALAADADVPAGALSYDFSKGGAYVAAHTHTTILNDAAELRVGAKSTRNAKITVRLIDATGQCHQYPRACTGSGSWETLRVALNQKASEHWGGANDGKMHFPIRDISLGVGKPGEVPLTGTVEFGQAVTVGR